MKSKINECSRKRHCEIKSSIVRAGNRRVIGRKGNVVCASTNEWGEGGVLVCSRRTKSRWLQRKKKNQRKELR
jgi:hypothetical protein